MTEKEAKLILNVRISRFDHANDVNEALDVAKTALKEIQQYRTIGTVEECRKAMERQKPKKPITYKETNREDCPVCGATVKGITKPFGDWCSKCGQFIDWSNTD